MRSKGLQGLLIMFLTLVLTSLTINVVQPQLRYYWEVPIVLLLIAGFVNGFLTREKIGRAVIYFIASLEAIVLVLLAFFVLAFQDVSIQLLQSSAGIDTLGTSVVYILFLVVVIALALSTILLVLAGILMYLAALVGKFLRNAISSRSK